MKTALLNCKKSNQHKAADVGGSHCYGVQKRKIQKAVMIVMVSI